MKNRKNLLILIFIIVIGFLLRLIGLNWDQGQHLHPDERFLTMVSSAINLSVVINIDHTLLINRQSVVTKYNYI